MDWNQKDLTLTGLLMEGVEPHALAKSVARHLDGGGAATGSGISRVE